MLIQYRMFECKIKPLSRFNSTLVALFMVDLFWCFSVLVKLRFSIVLSGCLFGGEHHNQSSAVTNPGQETRHSAVFPRPAHHAGPQGDSPEGTGLLREETQRLCFQQPGSSYVAAIDTQKVAPVIQM